MVIVFLMLRGSVNILLAESLITSALYRVPKWYSSRVNHDYRIEYGINSKGNDICCPSKCINIVRSTKGNHVISNQNTITPSVDRAYMDQV